MVHQPFPRQEMEDMVQRWIAANEKAEKTGNWKSLATFYTDTAEYRWNMGPNQEFVANGRDEIRDIALDYHMKGFENWKYPYQDVIIDETRGTVVCFYEQIGPGRRSDGSLYQVDGVSGSRFEYAGNYQWRFQRDFFDLGNVKALMFEMAGANQLDQVVKHKIYEQARGQLLPGTERRRPEPSFCAKVHNFIAMIRIVALGR